VTASSKRRAPRRVRRAHVLSAVILLPVALLLAHALLVIAPNLPAVDTLLDYQPKMPLRVYTADNILIGEFGPERREFVPIAQMPAALKNALLSIEDDDFYTHGGISYLGIVRAALADLRGGLSQGGSTITMQVARNFFLTRDKTYTRKLSEIMLAWKIESRLSKDQILELYMNQIYLGQRAYGFATAARTYFGKPVQELSIAEAAMLAGLPKAPSAYNPVVNPKRARQRQQYILRRMRELDHITQAQYEQAAKEILHVREQGRSYAVHAEYVAETVRQMIVAQYKDEAYTSGLNVYTTINSAEQEAAWRALRRQVMAYEQRHGYRGPEETIALPDDAEAREQAIDSVLQRHPASDELEPAVVLSASPKLVRAELASGDTIEISGEGLRFAAAALSARAKSAVRIRPGAVIRVLQDAKKRWSISQLPEVAAAFVALDAHDGSYRALVGGFDFEFGKFNHVTSAWRQPGSAIKPFIYSAALEKGFSPATLINDAPLEVDTENGKTWAPQNDDSFDGPLSMRTALVKSKNVIAVRVLRAIGVPYARDYLARFGFDPDRQPANLTLSLGTGAVTPLQLAGAYAVFANGGYRVDPYLVRRITDARGNLLSETLPVPAGEESERVLDPRNAFVVDSMLRDVVQSGTGAAAGQRLRRSDIAGKTGTTNDAVDGWFAGYAGNLVAVAWMGYDTPKSLGGHEFGATLALPIWAEFMKTALAGKPERRQPTPNGLQLTDGDWLYGEYADAGVRTLDMDAGSWLERLFGMRPATAPVNAPAAAPAPAPKPKQWPPPVWDNPDISQ
jgi:penicillin-binding protein 1A